jgi:hypothetical protein
MRLGNLDNLALGMGLVAKKRQVLPAKYATLEGFGQNEASKPKKYLGLLGTLFIILVVYKMFSK